MKRHDHVDPLAGSNVIPANVFPSKVTPALLEELVMMAKESNQNMLRVWGGGMYPLDAFYDATDANGIMVWQEAMFACAMYPTNAAFLNDVSHPEGPSPCAFSQ